MGPIGSATPTGQQGTTAAALAARQALARATAMVEEDKRNHSPSCVACDQKVVDRDAAALAQATAATSTTASAGQMAAGSSGLGLALNITV